MVYKDFAELEASFHAAAKKTVVVAAAQDRLGTDGGKSVPKRRTYRCCAGRR